MANPLTYTGESIFLHFDQFQKETITTTQNSSHFVIPNNKASTGGNEYSYVFKESSDYKQDSRVYHAYGTSSLMNIRLVDNEGKTYTGVPEHWFIIEITNKQRV